ncbi:hypothetical protein A9974_14760 [Achromobacter sp. UMC71]|nr:hypothetical protein [Achromobacter sp. UMC71]
MKYAGRQLHILQQTGELGRAVDVISAKFTMTNQALQIANQRASIDFLHRVTFFLQVLDQHVDKVGFFCKRPQMTRQSIPAADHQILGTV